MKIKYICVPSFHENCATAYFVGHDEVTEIRDASVDYKNRCYNVYKGRQCIATLENCPVIIEFFEDES